MKILIVSGYNKKCIKTKLSNLSIKCVYKQNTLYYILNNNTYRDINH